MKEAEFLELSEPGAEPAAAILFRLTTKTPLAAQSMLRFIAKPACLDGPIAARPQRARVRADPPAPRRLRDELHRNAGCLKRAGRPAHRSRSARPLWPRPADDRSVLAVDLRHRAPRRFRLQLRMAAAGQQPDLGAHGPDAAAHLRDAAADLGYRAADRRLFRRAEILDWRLHRDVPQLSWTRHPELPARARADVSSLPWSSGRMSADCSRRTT